MSLARAHYENFPVASWLLPAPMRPHVAAVYAFARIADDLADEGDVPEAERRARLASWQARLRAAVADAAGPRPDAARDDLVLAALASSVRTVPLPPSLFDDLVSAFSQDTLVKRYASWDELLGYCRRSANPVGRLVLRIAGYDDERLDRSSDAFCTALQLTNFWQDFGRDWRAGRLYVPRDVMQACGADERDLEEGRVPAAWRTAIEACVERTRGLFEDGVAVCDAVGGRLKLELRLTWCGGVRILERVAGRAADVLVHRPRLGPADAPALAWRALRWQEART